MGMGVQGRRVKIVVRQLTGDDRVEAVLLVNHRSFEYPPHAVFAALEKIVELAPKFPIEQNAVRGQP